jgi:uncharacterized membrane protein YkvA (DUF1232 family)
MMTNQHAPREVGPGEKFSQGPDVQHESGTQVELAPLWDLIKRLPTYVKLSTALARDSRVPGKAKVTLALGGIYVVSPVDLIPGLIPVAGQLDDLYVVLTGLQQAVRLTPAAVVDEHLIAVGLTSKSIDDDLATLRTFVRQGLTWTFQQGGKAVASASRQTRSLIHSALSWGSNLR